MRRLAAICAALVLLAACGGDDEETGGETGGEPGGRNVTVNPNSTLRVTADEYFFDPDGVVVRGAGRLTIRLQNAGNLAHNLKLNRAGETVGGTPTFPGGDTRTGVVNLEHGRYQMVCTVGDHAELGMTGQLQVR